MFCRVFRRKLSVTSCFCICIAFGLFMTSRYPGYNVQYSSKSLDSQQSNLLLPDDVIQQFIKDTATNFNLTMPGSGNYCKDYVQSARMNRPVLKDLLKQLVMKSSQYSSITLVTQMTWSRSHNLFLILDHWAGPVCVCIYDDTRIVNDIIRNITKYLTLQGDQFHRQVLVYFVHKIGLYYPVNYLRNVALDAATTRYVLLNDVDFIPMPGAHDKLLAWMSPGLKRVLVVPAFEEVFQNATHGVVPNNKTMLLRERRSGSVQGFHERFYALGHHNTNYPIWMSPTTTTPYKIYYSRDFEPYIVGERSFMPRYDTDFVGRQLNKVSHIMELHAWRFEFWVCPDVFLLHIWHSKNTDHRVYGSCTMTAMRAFRRHLEDVRKNQTIL